jgi:hypothetical protein
MSNMQYPEYAPVQENSSRPYRLTETVACSLQCSKDHKAECGGQPKTQADAALQDGTHHEPDVAKLLVGISPLISVDAIASAAEIQELLVKYPKLHAQLHAIYDASLESDHTEQYTSNHRRDDSSRSRGRGYHRPYAHNPNQHRTVEKGFDKALKNLQWRLEATDADAIGLNDFCETVTKMRATEQNNHT